jgi:hypothetical protein
VGEEMKNQIDQMQENIIAIIRQEANAIEEFVRDVELFLNELPIDLGKGSLNGMKAQLQHKCAEYLNSR